MGNMQHLGDETIYYVEYCSKPRHTNYYLNHLITITGVSCSCMCLYKCVKLANMTIDFGWD